MKHIPGAPCSSGGLDTQHRLPPSPDAEPPAPFPERPGLQKPDGGQHRQARSRPRRAGPGILHAPRLAAVRGARPDPPRAPGAQTPTPRPHTRVLAFMGDPGQLGSRGLLPAFQAAPQHLASRPRNLGAGAQRRESLRRDASRARGSREPAPGAPPSPPRGPRRFHGNAARAPAGGVGGASGPPRHCRPRPLAGVAGGWWGDARGLCDPGPARKQAWPVSGGVEP